MVGLSPLLLLLLLPPLQVCLFLELVHFVFILLIRVALVLGSRPLALNSHGHLEVLCVDTIIFLLLIPCLCHGLLPSLLGKARLALNHGFSMEFEGLCSCLSADSRHHGWAMVSAWLHVGSVYDDSDVRPIDFVHFSFSSRWRVRIMCVLSYTIVWCLFLRHWVIIVDV